MLLLRAQLGAVLHGAAGSLQKGGLTGLLIFMTIGVALCFMRLAPCRRSSKTL
jgi:hypothetical protein